MTLNLNGKILDLSSPKVMGIMNITPDSFYENSRFRNEKQIVENASKMIGEGATILDIGGYSSRPTNAKFVDSKEESRRVLPVIQLLRKTFPDVYLSIDTFRANIAQRAIEEGVNLINDISGGEQDIKMFETVIKNKIPYVMMHMRGNPQTMMQLTSYKNVTKEVLEYFIKKIKKLKNSGFNDIIIDLGFGFSKTINQNFELLNSLSTFKHLNVPILVGISRKSIIYKTLNISQNDALNGTSALHMVALKNGASILRVHDVKEAMQVIKLNNLLNQASFN